MKSGERKKSDGIEFYRQFLLNTSKGYFSFYFPSAVERNRKMEKFTIVIVKATFIAALCCVFCVKFPERTLLYPLLYILHTKVYKRINIFLSPKETK